MGCRALPEDRRRQQRRRSVLHRLAPTVRRGHGRPSSGRWEATRQSHPVRLLGNAIDRHLNFVSHVTVAARQTVPRRRRLRLGAGAGASQHTMRSLRVGCVHSALHNGGAAIAPCPAPTHLHSLEVRQGDGGTASLGPRVSAKGASVHLEANPAPLRRIIVFRAPHSTNASHVSVVLRTCVAQSAWKPHLRQYLGRQRRPFRCREMPSSRNCDASAATW
ncbi:hypothetical protein TcG_01806 [Trypanosoma cruzi]|nr:hypothetical protein TcG_01806 [Trypanosoma cruzi]